MKISEKKDFLSGIKKSDNWIKKFPYYFIEYGLYVIAIWEVPVRALVQFAKHKGWTTDIDDFWVELFMDKVPMAIIAIVIALIIKYIRKMLEERLSREGGLEDMISNVLNMYRNKPINSIDIYGYTGINYIRKIKDMIKDSGVKVQGKVRFLLSRASEYRAWNSRKDEDIEKYRGELKEVIGMVEKLECADCDCEIRFIDDRPLVHFCIINGKYVITGQIPIIKKSGGLVSSRANCYIISESDDVCIGYQNTFNTWFENGFYDSGLNILLPDNKCNGCRLIRTITSLKQKHSFANTLLLKRQTPGVDFYLIPDGRPISKIHILLICKYHVLNLYDYFRRKKTMDGVEKVGVALNKLIRHIQKSVKEDILIFEHGSMNPYRKNKSTSIDHLHVHVILKNGIDIKKLIEDDFNQQKKNNFHSIVQCRESEDGLPAVREYKEIDDFVDDPEMGSEDYFLIWDIGEGKVYVYLKNNCVEGDDRGIPSSSQYLRKLFFGALSIDDKKYLYGDEEGNVPEDVWRRDEEEKFPEKSKGLYEEIARCLKDEIKGGLYDGKVS